MSYDPTTLSPSQVAYVTGLSADTIRRYSDVGLIPSRRHPVNGRRLFRLADVEDLKRRLQGER